MALVNRAVAKKKPVPPKKSGMVEKKNFPSIREREDDTYFSCYSVTSEIKEGGEFLAKPKEHIVTETKDFVILKPFRYEDNKKVYFEEVYLNLELDNSPTSAAGKFINIFKEKKDWTSISACIIGVEIKLVEGKNTDGKEPRIFKNVVDVFEVDEDALIIDNKHQTQKNTSKTLAIASIPDEDEEEILDDEEDILDDEEIESSRESSFEDDIIDEDDDDFEED